VERGEVAREVDLHEPGTAAGAVAEAQSRSLAFARALPSLPGRQEAIRRHVGGIEVDREMRTVCGIELARDACAKPGGGSP
jgi:hypothetical protein